MNLRNQISLEGAPWKSLTVIFGLLICWFALSLALPLYAVKWVVSNPELANGRVELTILLTWCIAVSATMLFNRLLRNEWVAEHCAWADSWMETVTYPLRGEQDS